MPLSQDVKMKLRLVDPEIVIHAINSLAWLMFIKNIFYFHFWYII